MGPIAPFLSLANRRVSGQQTSVIETSSASVSRWDLGARRRRLRAGGAELQEESYIDKVEVEAAVEGLQGWVAVHRATPSMGPLPLRIRPWLLLRPSRRSRLRRQGPKGPHPLVNQQNRNRTRFPPHKSLRGEMDSSTSRLASNHGTSAAPSHSSHAPRAESVSARARRHGRAQTRYRAGTVGEGRTRRTRFISRPKLPSRICATTDAYCGTS